MTNLMGGPRDGASEARGDYHGSAALRKNDARSPPPSPAGAVASIGLFSRSGEAYPRDEGQ